MLRTVVQGYESDKREKANWNRPLIDWMDSNV